MKSFRDYLWLSNSCSYDVDDVIGQADRFEFQNFCSPGAEDMLKSAVIEEKKLKQSPWAGADNPLGPKFWCQQEALTTMVMVICCKFKKNLFNLWLYTHLFMI